MTNEELAIKIKAGQRELIPQLWGQIERLCALHANRVSRSLPSTAVCDFDDLHQCGFLALLKAIEYFDPDSGYSFTTYFAHCHQAAMAAATGFRTAKQKRDPTRFARSLDAPISDDSEVTLGEVTADSRDPIEALENEMYNEAARKAIQSLFTLLTENERKVIEEHYLEGKHYVKIAEDLGLTRQQVNRLKDMAFRKMRTKMLTVPESQFFREFIESRTNFSLHIGVSTFLRTRISAVEAAVFERDRLEREALLQMPANSLPKDLKTPLELYQASTSALNRFDAYRKRQRKGRL